MKILHLADIHARDKNLLEIEKCLDFVIETARDERPDVIINAGDTFDSRNVRVDSPAAKMIFRVFSELAEVAPVATITGTASHDGNAVEVLRYIKARHSRVWVSIQPEQIYLCEEANGKTLLSADPANPNIKMSISMCPAPTKQFFNTDSDIKGTDNEIAQAMSKIFAGFATQASQHAPHHILVGHWNVTGALISETQTLTGRDIEISAEQMDLANASLACLGHIHKHQQLTGTNIYFSGSTQSNTWGEMTSPGFYLHEMTEDLLKSTFITTPSIRRVKFSADYTTGRGRELVPDILRCRYDLQNSVTKLDIKVYQDEASKINIDELKQKMIAAGCQTPEINLIRVTRENTRSETLLTLDRLRDKITEMAKLETTKVSELILLKADQLEDETATEIIESLTT